MRHVRASSGRRAAAVAADVTAVADTVGVGGVTVVASEEAATSQPLLPADRCCRVRCLSGFALAADLISALRTAHATAPLGNMGRAGFEPAKAYSQQIYSLPRLATSVPTLLVRGISYILLLHRLLLVLAFEVIGRTIV